MVVRDCDHQDLDVRHFGLDQARCLQPVHFGQVDIHEHEVRLERSGLCHGLNTVTCVAYNFVAPNGKQALKTGPEQLVIVNQ